MSIGECNSEPALPPYWPKERGFHLDVPDGNAFCILARSTQRHPDRAAIHYYGRSISYRALLGQVEALAGFLQHACGVKRGDHVLLDMQNSPQYVVAFHAILRADAVVVPVNPMNTTEELDYIVTDSGARTAIIGDELIERFEPLMPGELAHLIVARYADAAPADCADPLPEVMRRPPPALADGHWHEFGAAIEAGNVPSPLATDQTDLALMAYSSGTTGRPKACMHPHSAVVFSAVAQAVWYGLDETDVMTSFMPLFHVAGMQASMNAGLHAGAALVVMTRWDRDLIPRWFERHGVTWWSAAPTMVVDVLASDTISDASFARLKIITGGGASMPAAVAERLHQRYGLTFCEGYGLTETISASHLNPVTRSKPQCLGLPIFDTHSRIVDPLTLQPCATGEVGEILISGPQVTTGYWKRPDADAEAFVTIDGRRWLRSGDLGYVDEEGYYFIVDRLKRMVNVSGYKVWPAECEMLLYRHPAVRECCVIAAPDAYRGETVKALIALKPEARGKVDAEEIADFARTVMAAYKVPRVIEFVDELPRSASNKIDWRKLQEAEWEKAGSMAGGGHP